MGGDERRYLLARAIQLFLPGIPQIYYVGLLAGHNDMALLAQSGVGRDINRHYYSRAEIDSALHQPVVRDLLALIRLRNTHAAFGGAFRLLGSDAAVLTMRWDRDAEFAALRVNFESADFELSFSSAAGVARSTFESTPPQADYRR